MNIKEENNALVQGGFCRYESALPSAQMATISFDPIASQVKASPRLFNPGGLEFVGVAGQVAREYIMGKTVRAAKARNRCCPDPIGLDPAKDARFLEGLVRFVIDNATGKDKPQVGGPIDMAILKPGKPIRWIKRKRICAKEDEP
jgi:hypothetical protein